MPQVGFQVSVPATGSAKPVLNPYDRFGGGGGVMQLRSTTPLGTAGSAIRQTLFIGSEMVVNKGFVGAERATGAGPDDFTSKLNGVGGGGDPIDITYENTTGAAIVVTGILDIQNA